MNRKRTDMINDLVVLKQFFEERSGATPVCLDYAIDELSRTGEWWKSKDDEVFAPEYYCNQCGNRAEVDLYGEYILSDYCPHCGAEMIGESDERINQQTGGD